MKNSEFVGKLWKIDNQYIWVDEVKRPRTYHQYVHDAERSAYESRDGEHEYRAMGYSKLIGKNEYNQRVSVELTPLRRASAVETTWEEYMVAGIS